MTAKHTQGPWKQGWATTSGLTGPRTAPTCYLPAGIIEIPIHSPTGPVAWILSSESDGLEESDARLIAVAPELLESAKLVMAWWEEHQYDTTGERGEWNVFDTEPEFVTAARAAIAKVEGGAA